MIQAAYRTKNFTYAIRNIVHEAKKLEAQGRTVTYLNIGDPIPYGYRPPEHLVYACEKALRDGYHGYTPSLGIMEAREAIAMDSTKKGMPLSAEDVIITSGASEAADLILSSLLEPKDEWLVPSPGYPLYTAILAKLGAKEVPYKAIPEEAWEVSVDEISRNITPKTKGIVVINPNNPTGAIYRRETLLQILDLATKYGLLVIADEVYGPMSFGQKTFYPMASLASDQVPLITLESMSKVYLAPGWRIGWMKCMNNHLMTELRVGIHKMADARLCSPRLGQHAIHAAMTGPMDYLDSMMSDLKTKRDYVLRRIAKIPSLRAQCPEGAFYMMGQIQDARWSKDEEFVLSFLKEKGILFVHGSGFGTDPKDGFFRLVYLPNQLILKDVFDQLEDFLMR